jgi:very-short-patch-repair endonuclease
LSAYDEAVKRAMQADITHRRDALQESIDTAQAKQYPKGVPAVNLARLGGIDDSELEREFDTQWARLVEGYTLTPQVVFDGSRQFKVDRGSFVKVAVECEGFDHRLRDRYTGDLTKYNLLSLQGWVLLRCTTGMIQSDPIPFFRLVVQALNERGISCRLREELL